ncbi:MAG TPA: Ig-like domain-containing protein [Gemmatimonadaceae bacterium]|nr:Ig-like domain-containing protein [Gemmatimonadaceae bacterium]
MKKAFLFVCGFVATSMVIAACGELTGPTSPETPINVTATLSGPSTATITWQKSAQSDGVISFNILRNGQKVGETEGTSFTDTGLGEKQTYKYTVSANCTSGVLSDPSPESPAATITTLDITGPKIVQISPFSNQTGVSTGATVVVTFNEPIDAQTVNTTTFSLKVTATGANIPGTVTFNPTTLVAEFKPTSALPSGTSITATVTAGVKDLAGNPLQLTAGSPGTWTFTTRDETAPTVLGFTPANGQVGVGTNPPITVTFSEAMDQNTINTSTITLRVTSTGALVPGAVTYNATTHVATFTPNAPLAVPVNYTIGVSTGVKDLAGNALAVAASSSFTTADLSAPTVTSTSPASGAANVPVNSTISATFSKPMDQSTFTASTFQVKTTVGGAAVAGAFGYNAATNTVTFTPSANLASQTAYTVTITTGVKDANGIAMAAPFTWTFSTADVTAPTATVTSPTNGQSNVPTGTTITVTFSEPMDPATVSGAITVRNTNTSAPVAGTVAYIAGSTVATFTPTVALANGTSYTVTVATTAKDVAGNPLAAQVVSTFTTAPAPDTTAPTVLSTNPADGASSVATSTLVTATFSEAMDASTILAAGTFTLKKTVGGAAVPGTVTYNSGTNTATFTPTAPLSANTGYTATITTAAKDLAGNQLAANKVFAFTTAVDNVAPTVISRTPTAATNVPVTTPITVTFSEDMDSNTLTTSTFTVSAGGVNVTNTTVTYDAATRTATLGHFPLLPNVTYTVTVTTGAKDVNGNPLTGNFSFTFTTAP